MFLSDPQLLPVNSHLILMNGVPVRHLSPENDGLVFVLQLPHIFPLLRGTIQKLLDLVMEFGQPPLVLGVGEVDVGVRTGRDNIELWVKHINALDHEKGLGISTRL